MALITLEDSRDTTPAVTLCDAGADVAKGSKAAAWISVAIRSRGAKAGGPCLPDPLTGRMLHALIRFYIPGPEKPGKRSKVVDNWWPAESSADKPIDIAFDAGTVWVGSKAALFLRGGRTGDQYEVTIDEFVPRDIVDPELEKAKERAKRIVDVFEDPFQARLTSYFLINPDENGGDAFVNFPDPPPYHQWFYVVQGSAVVTMPGDLSIPLSTSYGPGGMIPLSAPQIRVGSGIYVTSREKPI